MGRYAILLILPIAIGVLIAAAAVIITGLRERRIDARLALDATRPNDPSSSADSHAKDESTHRRIAS